MTLERNPRLQKSQRKRGSERKKEREKSREITKGNIGKDKDVKEREEETKHHIIHFHTYLHKTRDRAFTHF